MHLVSRRSAGVITAVVLGMAGLVGLGQTPVAAQGGAGGATSAATSGREPKTEDVFVNIKSLSGQSAETLNPTMVFFEASLGVGCPYCHDPDANKRDLDSNPRKNVARRMIEMVNTINKTTFGGARQVTCFTCHMGRSTPIGTPNVIGEELPRALGEDFIASLPPPPAVPAVTAAQVLDKYVAALGGAGALQSASSLTAVGTVTQRRPGRLYPANQIDIFSKAGASGLTVTKAGQNDNLLAYGADSGWARAGTAAARDLRKAEYDATKLEDTFGLPVLLRTMLVGPTLARPEVVHGRELYVVAGRTKNLPLVKAYFDKESGMLARLVYYIDTSFGRYPTQIEYGDVRDVGGRKVPYSWVVSQTRNREYTYVMQSVKAAAIDDSKFARPGGGSR